METDNAATYNRLRLCVPHEPNRRDRRGAVVNAAETLASMAVVESMRDTIKTAIESPKGD